MKKTRIRRSTEIPGQPHQNYDDEKGRGCLYFTPPNKHNRCTSAPIDGVAFCYAEREERDRIEGPIPADINSGIRENHSPRCGMKATAHQSGRLPHSSYHPGSSIPLGCNNPSLAARHRLGRARMMGKVQKHHTYP